MEDEVFRLEQVGARWYRSLMRRTAFSFAFALMLPAGAAAQVPAAVAEQGWVAYRAHDFARAQPLFESSCEADVSAGCAGLFQLHGNGDGVPRDRVRAATFGPKACQLGHPYVCRMLGVWANGGLAAAEDPARAATLFARGCELSDVASCAELGVLRLHGHGGPADPAAALGLFTRAR